MTQNIYDSPEFFQGYSGLDRSIEGLAGAPEWPALRELLPDLRGLDVVDLGCGFGWFCRWAREQGAARVLGIDVSRNMLARASDDPADAAITYTRADLEQLDLAAASFGLAYSSLALHYIEDLAGLWRPIHRALVPAGRLVFSIEHPIYMAPTRPGWSVDADGRKTWPVDGYLVEGPAYHGLAHRGCREAAPHDRDHGEPAHPHRLQRSPISKSGGRRMRRSRRSPSWRRSASGRLSCSSRPSDRMSLDQRDRLT